jgi:hypothetical protein
LSVWPVATARGSDVGAPGCCRYSVLIEGLS